MAVTRSCHRKASEGSLSAAFCVSPGWGVAPPRADLPGVLVLKFCGCFRRRRRRLGWPACLPGGGTSFGRSWKRKGELGVRRELAWQGVVLCP